MYCKQIQLNGDSWVCTRLINCADSCHICWYIRVQMQLQKCLGPLQYSTAQAIVCVGVGSSQSTTNFSTIHKKNSSFNNFTSISCKVTRLLQRLMGPYLMEVWYVISFHKSCIGWRVEYFKASDLKIIKIVSLHFNEFSKSLYVVSKCNMILIIPHNIQKILKIQIEHNFNFKKIFWFVTMTNKWLWH